MKPSSWRLGVLAASLLACSLVARADQVLDSARALIQGGRGAEAYVLLAPLEAERAGDDAYDLLLGMAALDAGEPGLAIFALERAVAVNPNNAQARAELARAYFQIRDDQLARQEFEAARQLGAPEPVRRSIDEYLSALDLRVESRRVLQWRAHFEVGIGFDSNANSATNDRAVAVPALGNIAFTLAPIAREQSSPLLFGELGGTISYRLKPDLHAFAGGRADLRKNTADRAQTFDTGAYDFYGGLIHTRGSDVYTGALQRQVFRVDNSAFRNSSGLMLQWSRTLDANNQITGFAQFADLSYHPRAQRLRDVHQILAGAGWGHTMQRAGNPTVFASGYVARDLPRHSGVGHLRRDFYGVRAGGQYSLRGDLDLVGSAGLQLSNYDGTEPLFGITRDDKLLELILGLRWRPMARVTVKPELRYTRNVSDVPISDFTRFQGLVSLRYDFR